MGGPPGPLTGKFQDFALVGGGEGEEGFSHEPLLRRWRGPSTRGGSLDWRSRFATPPLEVSGEASPRTRGHESAPSRPAHTDRSTRRTRAQGKHPARCVLDRHFRSAEFEPPCPSRRHIALPDRDLLGQSQRVRCSRPMRDHGFSASARQRLDHLLRRWCTGTESGLTPERRSSHSRRRRSGVKWRQERSRRP